jgi:hypothetical protein
VARRNIADLFSDAVKAERLRVRYLPPEKLSRKDIVKVACYHGVVLGASTFSAYVFWGSSFIYFASDKSLGHKIPSKRAKDILAAFSGFCGVGVNTLQAADITTEEIESFLRTASPEEKKLFGGTTLGKKIKNNPDVVVCFVLSAASTVPLGVIMHKQGNGMPLVVTTMGLNCVVNFRGISNLKFYIPIMPFGTLEVVALKRGKRALAKHLVNSNDNLLQKDLGAINAQLDVIGTLEEDDVHPIIPLLNLDADGGYSKGFSPSFCRMLLMILSIIIIVGPQVSYIQEAWQGGAEIDSKDSGLSIFLTILNALVYVGLSLDAALELSSTVGNGRKTLYSHLNSAAVTASGIFLGVTGLPSGVTLASTTLDNMVDNYDPAHNTTALIHPPMGVVRAFEVCSLPSDGGTNAFYALCYAYVLLRIYYRTRSENQFKQRLVKLDEAVTNVANMLLHMAPWKFKEIVTSKGFPRDRVTSIFHGAGLKQAEIDAIFHLEIDEEALLGRSSSPSPSPSTCSEA